LVVLGWVDGELAQEFAGFGVDGADAAVGEQDQSANSEDTVRSPVATVSVTMSTVATLTVAPIAI
jgi:hypothetical protein